MESSLIRKIHITFLSLVVAASHVSSSLSSSSSIESYWNSELPNTPMPKAIKDSLPQTTTKPGLTSVGSFNVRKMSANSGRYPFFYRDAATEDDLRDNPIAALYFRGDALLRGNTMKSIQFVQTTYNENDAVFLPRSQAEKIPFSSRETARIFERFSVVSGSAEARAMQRTIESCEAKPIRGEEKYCATSLEDMLDFSKSKLGKTIGFVVTDAGGAGLGGETTQDYTILRIRKMKNKGKAVVCHKMKYAYAVFNCHVIPNTDAYEVSLVGVKNNNIKVKAAAVCHKNTSSFNPQNFAFKVLNVKPGAIPICHFLPEGHIVWIVN